MVRADTLKVRYNLAALAQGMIHAHEVHAAGLAVVIRPTEPDTTTVNDPIRIRLDQAHVRRSQLRLPWAPDTTLQVDVDYLDGWQISEPTLEVRLDSSVMTVYGGGEPLRITGPASLVAGVLEMRLGTRPQHAIRRAAGRICTATGP